MKPAVRRAGFTLLEVLVVAAIVAIASVLLVPSLSRSDAAVAEKEARRLASLLDLALTEARANGRTYAWSAETDGYVFWRRAEDGTWTRFSESSPYRRRGLPNGTQLQPFRGEVVHPNRALARGERILLLPFGLSAPFAVIVSAGGARLIVKGNAVGRVTVERIHAG